MVKKANKETLALQIKIKNLESNIPFLLEKMKMARLDGDLSENADWLLSKEKYENSQRQILVLKDNLKKMQKKTEKKEFVVYQNLENGKENLVEVVENWEINPLRGKISKNSPLGSVLVQKKEGEIGKVVTSVGEYEIKIIKK